MKTNEKVRLSDIAEKLGISTVTVSKALSNKEGVGDDLRKKIKNLAEEMGYKSKISNAIQANSRITGNIGIVIPTRFFSPSSSYYWYIFNHLSTELLHRNYYTIMELLTPEDEKNLGIPRLIQDKKVDGLIILGQLNDKYIENLNANYDKFILLDFYTNNMSLDCVANDNYYCSYMLTSYVINQGHRKLRFVGSFEATSSIRDRYMGFQKALLENNINSDLSDIIPDRDENGQRIKIPLPSSENMPTAFICNCDDTAIFLIDELENLGYKVPDDISVTGFDNYISNNKISFGLTTVYIRPEDTASVAADIIIKKITQQPYIKGRHLISGSIVIRDSVKQI